MKNKLKYPIKLDDGKVLSNIKDEMLFFKKRERMIRENFYTGSSEECSAMYLSSSKCCYGIEII